MYVVSADILLLLKQWAQENNFTLPEEDFFLQIRKEFSLFIKKIFPRFEFLCEEELAEGMRNIVRKCGLYPVSIDRVYFPKVCPNANFIDVCRVIDKKGNVVGWKNRPGTPSLSYQLEKIKDLKRYEVVLIDDVIFGGRLMENMLRILSEKDLRVRLICAGVGMEKGLRRIRSAGIEVRCVRKYEKLRDLVCERDFYPGIPLSGLVLATKNNNNIGVPYILPFGRPKKWASIPSEWEIPFSRFCIQLTIELFKEIEKCSKKEVDCKEVARKITDIKGRFVDILKVILASLY